MDKSKVSRFLAHPIDLANIADPARYFDDDHLHFQCGKVEIGRKKFSNGLINHRYGSLL